MCFIGYLQSNDLGIELNNITLSSEDKREENLHRLISWLFAEVPFFVHYLIWACQNSDI